MRSIQPICREDRVLAPHAFGATAWCERDYFQTKEDDALAFSWQRFADVVKYERRYLFLRLDKPDEYAEASGRDVTIPPRRSRRGAHAATAGSVKAA